MRIWLNGKRMNLQEGDEVSVERHSCDTCGYHTSIEVRRDNKRVAYFGDEVRLFEEDKQEFGDVVSEEDR